MTRMKQTALAIATILITACSDNEQANQTPIIEGVQLQSAISFDEQNQPYMPYEIVANVSDPDGDSLTYRWRLLTSTNKFDLNNTRSKSLAFNYPMTLSEEPYFLAFELT